MNFDDKPILKPEDDKFGFDAFAQAIASSISNLADPEGSVIAINGAWGSGKSSIVNLVKHHLSKGQADSDLLVIDFKCWWFRGEDALALEFFRELYSAMDTSKSDKAKEAISSLGSRLLSSSSSFVGAALNLATVPGAGGIAAGGMNFLSDLIKQDKSIESVHQELIDELRKSSKRYLIIIDDIDRLSPDEALLIFRLVKSVGQLPNVMYLLAYDRDIAERVVSERYPSEGPQYLEKIVQAGFDIPNPPKSALMNGLIRFLNELWAGLETPDTRHLWNLIHDVVSPLINSPRDLLRIINTVKVSWAAVEGEVDPVDFLCMETLRVQRPKVYSALQNNKEKLTDGGLDRSGRSQGSFGTDYEDLFLAGCVGEDRAQIKVALRRLFPALEDIGYGSSFFQEWEKQRRVCSKKHFDTFFRFSLSSDIVSMKDVGDLIERCDDVKFVEDRFRYAKSQEGQNGGTRVAPLLDELICHADKVPLEKTETFLSAIFSIHDDIDLEADKEPGFAFANNNLRVHWLMRALIMERTTLSERSDILKGAAVNRRVKTVHIAA